LKFPDEPNPRSFERVCADCGSTIGKVDPDSGKTPPGVCPNCGSDNFCR